MTSLLIAYFIFFIFLAAMFFVFRALMKREVKIAIRQMEQARDEAIKTAKDLGE